MDIERIEKSLAGESYKEVDKQLTSLDNEQLIALLDCRSTRVGDTAASLLSRRGQAEAAVRAVLAGRVLTKTGKQRAVNILTWLGRNCACAGDMYVALLKDRHQAIVDSALFGLAFLQEKQHERAIRDAMTGLPQDGKLRRRFEVALEALEKEDPFVFSPDFHDAGDVWKLDRKRFGDKIGLVF